MTSKMRETKGVKIQGLLATAALAAVLTAASQSWAEGTPKGSEGLTIVPHSPSVFKADPSYADKPYSAEAQVNIYGGKRAVESQRPLLEIGRDLYTEGPYDKGLTLFGEKNLANPHLIVSGDLRTGVGSNDTGEDEQASAVTRLNLEVDGKITATERIHALIRPIEDDGKFTRYDFAGEVDDGFEFEAESDIDMFETLFFEGDGGAILQGLSGKENGIDFPFTAGLIPLITQNGVWMEDSFWGAAFSIPAFNSASLDISNGDISFFAGLDKVSSRALIDAEGDEEEDSNVYGAFGFLDMLEGYVEFGYAYVDAKLDDLAYHNLSASFTRRYGGWLSNSVRAVWNVGQDDSEGVEETADGVIFLIENSLITHEPLSLVPYFNLFAAFDNAQSVARNAAAGGILRNTGINFETDNLTGFPTLDADANDTYGGALGLQYLFALDKQVVFEFATVQPNGDDVKAGRDAQGSQYALGFRGQLPISKSVILRLNAMYGWLESTEDLRGTSLEARWKF